MNFNRACLVGFASMVLILPSYGELSTQLEAELAYSEPQQTVSKNQVNLTWQWQQKLTPDIDVTLTPKLWLDYDSALKGNTANSGKRADNYSAWNGPAYEDQNHRFELAEAYADMWFGETALRLGKQQVVWGQADGLKVLDVINPQNYREFNLADFEDSRIATWMLNVQQTIAADTSLQILLIPDLTFNELAERGSEFQITSPELAPQAVTSVPIVMHGTERPSDTFEHGVRLSTFMQGWEMSINYFNFYHDSPVIYRELIGADVHVTPIYESSQLLGFAANTVVDDWVLKMETGYIKDNYFLRRDLSQQGIRRSDELANVLAFDYHGISELMVSYQLFVSHILDYDTALIRQQNSVRHTLLFKKNLMQQTLELKWFHLYNQDYDDGQSRLKASYKLDDFWQVYAGLDYFFGNRKGPFGQFKDASRITFGWQLAY